MKSLLFAIALIALTAIAVMSCSLNDGPAGGGSGGPPAAVTATDGDDAFARKPEFIARVQGQLDAISRELDQLSTRVEGSSEPTRTEGRPRLQVLHDQATRLGAQLDRAKAASESAWDGIAAETSKRSGELAGAVATARQWVGVKTAP